MKYFLKFACFFAIIHTSVAQKGLTDEMKETEEKLYASTKQINQFFRRFNGEEDEKGERYYKGDKHFRDPGLRKKYLPILFDAESGYVSESLAREFVKEVADRKDPAFINFHSGEWFAEVHTLFDYKGSRKEALLYLKIQRTGKGYEWVITDVAFDPFKDQFQKDTSESKRFIHPMSHELDFMTLKKAFRDNPHPETFTPRDYEPDYLTLFIYEMKQGNLTFETVKDVRFHFFEVDGWYFEIANFNRPGYNTGWLISNLVKVNEQEKELLQDYIYDKN